MLKKVGLNIIIINMWLNKNLLFLWVCHSLFQTYVFSQEVTVSNFSLVTNPDPLWL